MNRRFLIAVVILIVVVAACGGFVIVNYYINQPLVTSDPQELYTQTGITIILSPPPSAISSPYSWESFTNLVMHRTILTPAGNDDAEFVVVLRFSNASPVPNEIEASLIGLSLWYPQQAWPFSSPSYGEAMTVCELNPPAGAPPPFQCGLVRAHNGTQSFGFGVIGAVANQTYTLRLQMKYANKVVIFETPITATGFLAGGFLGS